MSLAVFTDSTTAQASPALTLRPFSGNSTKTTSVNSCCAWSVMPTVALSPATRTHSCDFAYLKSDGTFDMAELNERPRGRSTWFSVNWFGHDYGRTFFPANLDLNRLPNLGMRGRHITHPNADVHSRALR